MSLSIGGYECGYGHPGAMGLSSASAHGYYGVLYPTQLQEYSERDVYSSFVINAAATPEISPDSYENMSGSPSPEDMSQYGYSMAETMHHMTHWRDFQMTDGELALAHNIPISELSHYESYTNVYGDRCLRRRTSANRKERRRTVSINNAFSNLRGSIPNVPSDTKLSKIKTLRLAISYISYLTEVLEKGDSNLALSGFKADISRKRERRVLPMEADKKATESYDSDDSRDSTGSTGTTGSSRDSTGSDLKSFSSTDDKSSGSNDSKGTGRTGWPQELWASELKCSPPHIPSALPATGPS